jgi:hypothetical protein
VFVEQNLWEALQERMIKVQWGLRLSSRVSEQFGKKQIKRGIPPPVFFVRVTNKGLMSDAASTLAGKGVREGESTVED